METATSHRRAGEGPGAPPAVEPFAAALARHGIVLERGQTRALQVNVGLRCNQACRHCHLEAGPDRAETMDRDTMDAVVGFAARSRFAVADVTGGAPELVPDLPRLLRGLRPHTPRLMLRSNLTALARRAGDGLLELLRDLRVVVVTSFPSTNAAQAESQRGRGVFEPSVAMLRRLNELGYGRDGTGLELDLVANPAGAFLPADQCQAERRFKRDLARRWGVEFNRLYTFANVPLGRFRRWLEASGNLEPYLRTLAERFNPATADGLMCRTQVSVAWDGCLYDCDFNLARGLPAGGRRLHVGDLAGPPGPGTPVATGDHCYACTAGSGFT